MLVKMLGLSKGVSHAGTYIVVGAEETASAEAPVSKSAQSRHQGENMRTRRAA